MSALAAKEVTMNSCNRKILFASACGLRVRGLQGLLQTTVVWAPMFFAEGQKKKTPL